ncbi:hypothetical protein BC936DRAFT_141533 [Jimgerdemannia flammicorona]|uniref:Uncharacterized protein n=1 Tax=Jimgerdemannia flammicorona TaxID=994334 RepID=A0A433A232_9FUNG|nr:hypothetical protein BC936DRAFT_141533 [Jimgerdemannia flammicorona]
MPCQYPILYHHPPTPHNIPSIPTRHPFLREYEVWLEGDDLVGHELDLLLLDLQNAVPVGFLGDLNVGLGFALLVFKRAIQQHDARVLNPASHLGVRHVLVQHDPVEDCRLFNLAAGDLGGDWGMRG